MGDLNAISIAGVRFDWAVEGLKRAYFSLKGKGTEMGS
jgi:hypothetical protein